MKTIKTGIWMLITLVFANTLQAQSVEDGKKLFYYEKYTSAKALFSQIANNVDATYWLGQSEIALDDIASATTLYQQALSANPNSPLLIVGMGHIELLEGKTQDARQRFETAISLSQGKNIAVLNAIGFANVDVKSGDADYAIDKLKLATTLKGMKDPDIYINLGDAYKKNVDGGLAIGAYESALTLNKTYAKASYKIGKIYLTQGASQQDIFMKYFNDAIEKDAAFAPVYYTLYDYYYSIDVTKSAEYLEKYLAAKGATDEPNSCYYRASMKYAQGLFAESIAESDRCIAGSATPFPNLYGLKAYAYNRLKDSANAKLFFDEYFKRQKPEKIGAGDYTTYANVLLKFPGGDSLATIYINKGVDLDSTETGKVSLLKTAAQSFEAQKKFANAAALYNKLLSVKKNVSKTDLYNAGYNYYRAGDYANSNAVFTTYGEKFPDDPFSYYMIGKANQNVDSTNQGLANPFFQKAIEVGSVDKMKYKPQLIPSYKYFVEYYANVKRDKEMALAYCDSILAIDSLDAGTIANKAAIASMKMTPPAPAKPTTKPAAPKSAANKPKEN